MAADVKCVKNALRNVVHSPMFINSIQDFIGRANDIVAHTYLVLKFIFIQHFDSTGAPRSTLEPYPLNDKELERLVDVIINLLTATTMRKKNDLCFGISFSELQNLVQTYIDDYCDGVYFIKGGLSNVLVFCRDDIVKNYKNSIVANLARQLVKVNGKGNYKVLLLDMENCPLNYLRLRYDLAKSYVGKMDSIFPLSSGFTAKYILMDSRALLQMCFHYDCLKSIVYDFFSTKNQMYFNLPPDKQFRISLKLLQVGIAKVEYIKKDLWQLFFNMNLLKKFRYTLGTDGYGVSILSKEPGSTTGSKRKNCGNKQSIPYVHHLSQDDKKMYQQSIMVGIDPNKRDLIYCCADAQLNNSSSNPKKSFSTFRYTQPQARKERSLTTFKTKRNGIKTDDIFAAENILSLQNSKALDVTGFKDYLKAYSLAFNTLRNHYGRMEFRKWRFHGFIKTQRSEANMVNRFKAKYGNDVIIGFGDWSSHGRHLRGLEPTKSSGMRKIFQRAGIPIVLVDEYRTSKMCSSCRIHDARLDKTYRKTFKPSKTDGKMDFHDKLMNDGVDYTIRVATMVQTGRHKVLQCGKCKTVWNRDFNAAKNILNILKSNIMGDIRPMYLRRGDNIGINNANL